MYPDYQQMNMYQYQNYQPPKRIFASIQGEAAADVYPVAAGQEVVLYDEDNPFVYFKSRDNNNRLTRKRFKLTEVVDKPVENHEDIKQWVQDAVREEVDRRFSEISITTKSTRKRGE